MIESIKQVANGSLTAEAFEELKQSYDKEAVLATVSYLIEYKLTRVEVKVSAESKETMPILQALVDFLLPELDKGVVLPVSYKQSIGLFRESIRSCDTSDSACLLQIFSSLLDYIALYFGTSYHSPDAIKVYQRNFALVEGSEAVSNLRIGEIIGFPGELPTVKSKKEE